MNSRNFLKELDERLMNIELYRKMKDRKAPLVNLGIAMGELVLAAEAYSHGDIRNGTDWANNAIINVGAGLLSYLANGDYINYANLGTNAVGGGIMTGAYKIFDVKIYLAVPLASNIQIFSNVIELVYKRIQKER